MLTRNMFMVVLIVCLSLAGCATDANDNDHMTDASDNGQRSDDTSDEDLLQPDPSGTVPGTSIDVYPGSELIYDGDYCVVYSSDASVDDLFDFYKQSPRLNPISTSLAEDIFFMQTGLVRIITGISRVDTTNEEEYEEYQQEVQSHIDEFGRLMTLIVGSADSDDVMKAAREEIMPHLPASGTVMIFYFWAN